MARAFVFSSHLPIYVQAVHVYECACVSNGSHRRVMLFTHHGVIGHRLGRIVHIATFEILQFALDLSSRIVNVSVSG